MSYFALKIYAMVFMLIDHVGYVLMRNDIKMRVVGRISFPLFGFLLVNGYYHTSNKCKYLLRMFIFAIVSEFAYDLTFYRGSTFEHQNVFFTLALGLMAIIIADKSRELIEKKVAQKLKIIVECSCLLLILGTFALINYNIHADYGWYGIMMIFFLYLTYGTTNTDRVLMAMSIIIPNLLRVAIDGNILQCYSILAISYIVLFVDKKINVPKWARILCYVFYPAHLLVIWYIKMYCM